jgi:hypothetical protein
MSAALMNLIDGTMQQSPQSPQPQSFAEEMIAEKRANQ